MKATAGSLARHIARRALDLFVIGWVLAVCVTTGRQFHDWWRHENAAVSLPAIDPGVEWSYRPLNIAIGPDGVTVHREPFAGTRSEVVRRLSELALQHTVQPAQPADEAERALLTALDGLKPLSSTATRQVFELATLMPAVVAVRREGEHRRITAHGMAFPAGQGAWTLFVLPHGPSHSSATWPGDAESVVSWSDAQGNAVAALRGDLPLTEMLAAFDERYGHRHAVRREATAAAVTVRYVTGGETVDVHLQSDPQGGWSGVVWISPVAATSQ